MKIRVVNLPLLFGNCFFKTDMTDVVTRGNL